jgi:ribulose-phosphate 3-epimerase
MIDICPTVDAENPHAYREQMERIAPFARRVHIDLGDGEFTPNKLVPIPDIWWPGGMRADLHVMYRRPAEHLDALMALGPQLVIVQAEADGDFLTFAEQLHRHGIEAGVALLQATSPEIIKPGLELIDHVLIFSGNLGHQGGSRADLQLLEKVKTIKAMKPTIEIAWDGGVNDQNIKQLIAGGVEVVNVGGFIQGAPDAAAAYNRLAAQAA